MLHEGLLARYHGLAGWQQTTLHVLLVLLVGYLVLKLVRTRLDAALSRAPRMDPTVRVFLVRVVYGFGWVLLVTVVLSLLHVDLTALLGGLAIGGFVVGFALKDTLGNLAAGLMLLFHRPFGVGDIVTLSGHTGSVLELGMALTVIRLFDGKIVTVPNASVLSGAIVNFTRNGQRRMELQASVSYHDDIDAAVRAVQAMLAQEPRILRDPAPEIVVTALGASGVDLEVRAWARNPDFGVINELRPRIKHALEQAGCTIPFPQLDVRLAKSA